MQAFLSFLVPILFAAILCIGLPYLVINRLFPTLAEHAPKQENYRGKKLIVGIGVVWFIWLALVWMGSIAAEAFGSSTPPWIELLLQAFPLLAGTCAFGFFDDWIGSSSIRGFRGHFAALRRGELTTGMLKMIGIGLLALFTAISLRDQLQAFPISLLRILCSTLTIALFANLLNLFDLRPLRATKLYVLCLPFAIASVALAGLVVFEASDVVSLAIACAGPIVATWRLDAHETAMLGDAGANTMGALLGFLFSCFLPLWLLALLTAALLAVNLLSERVSFTEVISHVPALKRLDELFRVRED